jgi:hypothetical protein
VCEITAVRYTENGSPEAMDGGPRSHSTHRSFLILPIEFAQHEEDFGPWHTSFASLALVASTPTA